MTLTVLDSPLYIPPIPGRQSASPSFTTTTVDADGEGLAVIFKVPYTTTITKVGFVIATHTTNGNLDASIETVSSGHPSGTLQTVGATATASITAAGYYEVTLGTAASVSRGDLVAFTLVRPTGSTVNTNVASYADGSIIGMPYVDTKTTSWAYNASNCPIMVLYDTSNNPITIPSNFPVSSITGLSFTSGAMRGNKFVPTVTVAANYVWVWADFDNNSTVKVYASDGTTLLASGTNGSNEPVNNNPTLNIILLDSQVTFTAGSTYYIMCVGAAGSNQFYRFTFQSTAVKASAEGFSAFTMVSTSTASPTSTADYTETSGSAMSLGILAEKVDIPAGGGGSVATNPIRGFIG